MARTSMMLLVLAITGTVASLLGLVGVYGIVSYAVMQRRREIGNRLALGAAQRLVASMGLTPFMTSQLCGVSPLDVPTHLIVALVLLTAAGVASYVSAHRASALDPVEVLKA